MRVLCNTTSTCFSLLLIVAMVMDCYICVMQYLSCLSRCDTVLGLCDGASRLQVTDKLCDVCKLHLVSVEYPKVRHVTLSLAQSLVTIVISLGVTCHFCLDETYVSTLPVVMVTLVTVADGLGDTCHCCH